MNYLSKEQLEKLTTQPPTPELVGVGSKELLAEAAELLATAAREPFPTGTSTLWQRKRVHWFERFAALQEKKHVVRASRKESPTIIKKGYKKNLYQSRQRDVINRQFDNFRGYEELT
jgi:hypothetical protein